MHYGALIGGERILAGEDRLTLPIGDKGRYTLSLNTLCQRFIGSAPRPPLSAASHTRRSTFKDERSETSGESSIECYTATHGVAKQSSFAVVHTELPKYF
jgi:hypothetical protein